jgi:formaldehyde-activating enzyme involved in methanogenesis
MSTSQAVNPLQYAVINAVMDELFENFIAQQVQSDVALKSAVESLTSIHMSIVDHLFPTNSQ